MSNEENPGEAATEPAPAPTSLEALQSWFQEHKTTPAFQLALKHRHNMAPGVADELKARAPGETDSERELAFMFSLTQIAEKLDMVAILMAGIQTEHLPPKQPEPVKVSHVDVTPLAVEHGEIHDEPTREG